jgi:hypothetical protein
MVPEALSPDDTGAMLARQLAPTLYLQRDETFPLSRAVAVLHPSRRVIAYYLLWRDDAVGAWVPSTIPTDEEEVWVEYDSTNAPTDLWTYWHGTVLHTDWRGKGQLVVDVQWGKHGSLPHDALTADLPSGKALLVFYAMAWMLPDLWLGNLTRRGPWCFCHGFRRYKEFTRPLLLAPRLNVIARTEDPDGILRRVFGTPYSRKPFWPWERKRGTRNAGTGRRERLLGQSSHPHEP